MGKVIATIVFIVLLLGFLVWSVVNAPEGIEGDYSAKVEVENPDEIENAISNVVSDIRKRDFVPIGVGVIWVPMRNCYSVKAKGIIRNRLISLKP